MRCLVEFLNDGSCTSANRENCLLRKQITSRIRRSDGERKTLAEIGTKLGKPALTEMATIVRPATSPAWHRKCVAQKCDGSQQRKAPGCPRTEEELEALVVRTAQENRAWGYDRIAGALHHLGYTISDQRDCCAAGRQVLSIPAHTTRKLLYECFDSTTLRGEGAQ